MVLLCIVVVYWMYVVTYHFANIHRAVCFYLLPPPDWRLLFRLFCLASVGRSSLPGIETSSHIHVLPSPSNMFHTFVGSSLANHLVPMATCDIPVLPRGTPLSPLVP